jgi:hypothetical protein
VIPLRSYYDAVEAAWAPALVGVLVAGRANAVSTAARSIAWP